jgi:hypothetical protein
MSSSVTPSSCAGVDHAAHTASTMSRGRPGAVTCTRCRPDSTIIDVAPVEERGPVVSDAGSRTMRTATKRRAGEVDGVLPGVAKDERHTPAASATSMRFTHLPAEDQDGAAREPAQALGGRRLPRRWGAADGRRCDTLAHFEAMVEQRPQGRTGNADMCELYERRTARALDFAQHGNRATHDREQV